jgi:serine/threonine-protein kinase RsbW
MRPGTFELTMDSNVEDATLASAVVRAFLSRLNLDEHESDMAELCLQEALVNCVCHAYGRKAGSVVRLRIELNTDEIHFEVEDQGKGTNKHSLQDAIRKSVLFNPEDHTTLSSSGRGMLIIHQVMDSWDYFQRDGWNVLRMSKSFGPASAEVLPRK